MIQTLIKKLDSRLRISNQVFIFNLHWRYSLHALEAVVYHWRSVGLEKKYFNPVGSDDIITPRNHDAQLP